MGQLVGNALSGMQTRGAIAPVQNQQPAQLPMQAVAQMPQQAAQPVAQPPAPLAGGQAQGLANAPAFVQQMVAQLMADRAANQQASMGQPFQGVTGQPVPDNFMPVAQPFQRGFPQQGMGFPQQNMPFNFPMRSNYFFGPMGSSFQSMQQQPFGGGFGGQQGLFGFNPYINPRIY